MNDSKFYLLIMVLFKIDLTIQIAADKSLFPQFVSLMCIFLFGVFAVWEVQR
jgi:hypothetical protein